MSEPLIDLSYLREREEKVLCALLGLQSQNGFGDGFRRSRKTVAVDSGITEEQIAEIKKRALAKVLKQNAKLYTALEQIEEVTPEDETLIGVAIDEENDMLGAILETCLAYHHVSDVLLSLAVACTFQANEAEKDEAEELLAVGAELMKIIAERWPEEKLEEEKSEVVSEEPKPEALTTSEIGSELREERSDACQKTPTA